MIEIDVIKSDLKKVLSGQKRFAIQGKNVEGSILSAVNFKIEDGYLIISTTDGTRALESKLLLLDNYGEPSGEFNLSMALVSKLSFIKGQLDEIRIRQNADYVEFQDVEHNSIQRLAVKDIDDRFPDLKNCFPQKNNFKVSVSQNLIKDIAGMKAHTGRANMNFDAKNNLSAILVETSSENLSQRALLMPIREEEEDSES